MATVATDFTHMAMDGRETEGKDPGWIVDSGANSHFVVNGSAFSLHCKTPGQFVWGISGSVAIAGRGDVLVVFLSRTGEQTQVILHNCTHVPDFHENLLLIPCLSMNGAHVLFQGDNTVFLEPTNGREFGFGRCSTVTSGLYEAQIILTSDLDHLMAMAALGVLVGPRTCVWEVLHRIFGHAHKWAIEKVVQENPGEFQVNEQSPRDYFCQACVERKMHVSPYPQDAINNVKAMGDLVVTNVWGPLQVESLQQNWYYMAFVDVYSRLSVVFFMRTKDQVKDYYKVFEALVKTQTGHTICQIRSDNRKEFINHNLQEYTASQGMILEQMAPYSSAQNGITERLNWTLVDLSMSGMAQHGLPHYLWQESITHANFVRNHLPTHATRRTLFEMFYGQKAPLQYMEEFGVEIWVLDQWGAVQKLDQRANK